MSMMRSLGLEAYDGNYTDRELVRRIMAGLNALPIHYSIRVQHFLDHYLGTANDPVPFGGREEELFALDDWRTDPSAPPYALLVAEAGRGKSALLVRWVDLLVASDDVHVIFVPISIRFETSLASVIFTMLAAGLGKVYGEPIESKDLSAKQWRDVCKSYLRRSPPSGKPLLVILDGLDEAADFRLGSDFFPSPPPSNVRVLVSARYLVGDVDDQGWRQRLGWESESLAYTQPLPPLTLDGVRDVLREMGIEPQSATHVEMVDELYRLSEGDPLLVRLYVEALFKGERAALMSVQQLQAMPPGLAGYFERWWEEQKKQSELRGRDPLGERKEVLDFFNLCAAALGPLTEQDITEIAGEALTSFWQHPAREVERFIIGDGKQQGYTFSHPRLGYYFWEQMNQAEQESWDKRFCDVGRRTLDALSEGTLHPAKASPYAIQYYGAHLERADAPPAAFYALVSEGWMRAWEALEGTHVGFLNDVERAWQRAENERDITMQIKCALCRASVAALSADIPPELLVLALEHDVLTPTQALGMAKNTQNRSYYASDNALVQLIPVLPSELLPEALAAAYQIRNQDWRDCTLSRLARQQPPELLPEVFTIIDQIRPECRRCALSHLGNQHPERLPELLAAARQIPDDEYRAYALSALVGQQPELLSEALAIIRQIRYDKSRADGLLQLAREALDLVRQIQNETQRVYALRSLAGQLPEELISEALDLVRQMRQIQNEHSRAEILSVLASQLPKELLPEALNLAHQIRGKLNRARVESALTNRFTKEFVQEVLRAPRQIKYEEAHIRALSALVSKFPKKLLPAALAFVVTHQIQSESERSHALSAFVRKFPKKLLPEALNLAHQIQHEWDRFRALSALAHQFPELLPELLAALQEISDPEVHLNILSHHVSKLPNELWPEALNLARKMEDGHWREDFLLLLPPYLPDELLPQALILVGQTQNKESRGKLLLDFAKDRPSILPELLAIARKIQDQFEHSLVLSALAPYIPGQLLVERLNLVGQIPNEFEASKVLSALAPQLSDQLLPKALTIAGHFQTPYSRARALSALAPHLADEQLPGALAIAHQIRDEEARARALSSLVPHLSGQYLSEVVAAAGEFQNEWSRAKLLSALAPQLPKKYLGKVLKLTRQIRNEKLRTDVFSALASRRAQFLPKALAAIRQIRHEAERVPHLLALAGQQPNLLSEALATIRQIESEWHRVNTLLTFARQLPEELLAEALALVCEIQDERARVNGLSGLTNQLPSELLSKVLVHQIQDEQARADMLSAIAPYLSDEFLPEALAIARQIDDFLARAKILSVLVPCLPELLPEALATVRQIEHEEARGNALSALIPHLSDEYLPEALAIARQIEHEGVRRNALSSLTPQYQPEALTTVRQIKDEKARAKALLDLASQRPEFIPKAFAAARHIQHKRSRRGRNTSNGRDFDNQLVRALKSLAPQLSEPLLREALNLAGQIWDEQRCVEVLSALANYLPPKLLNEALNIIGQIQDEWLRVKLLSDTLSVLVPKLSRWSQVEPDMAYIGWKQMIRILSVRARPAFLKDLSVLMPFMLALAGEDRENVAVGVCEAIQEVCEWWP